MAVAANAINSYPLKSVELICANRRSKRRERAPPLFISTNPSDVNPYNLRDLFTSSNHSCHRFPNVDSHGRVEPVDIHRLQIALSHSSVVVSVFCKPEDITAAKSSSESFKLGDLFHRVMPVTHSNGQLVGFGRAVSDDGLTASIYDVMMMYVIIGGWVLGIWDVIIVTFPTRASQVIPSLRGMGIGRMIVNRIIRMLTSRDIYDISALCSEDERLFFNACGFGDDILGSTTMIYTRTVSNYPEGDQMVKRVGRRLLLAPPSREPPSYNTDKSY